MKTCYIIGSGNSISQGINLGLWSFLSNKTTIGINETIRFFKPTIALFGDWTCYASRYQYFSQHDFVVGNYCCQFNHPEFKFPKQPNLILLQGSGVYHGKKGLERGLYSPILSGCFSLSLAICLGFKEIYLLGMDSCEIDGKTHWYQDIDGVGQYKDLDNNVLSGVGRNKSGEYRTSFYNFSDVSINKLWEPFTNEQDVDIFNVSPQSRISVFPKMSYETLFASDFPDVDKFKSTLSKYNKFTYVQK